jgi:hypothetical protein
MGAPPRATLARHVLPDIAGAPVMQAATVMPRAITTESVSPYFGLGVAPEAPSRGRMMAGATRFAGQRPCSAAHAARAGVRCGTRAGASAVLGRHREAGAAAPAAPFAALSAGSVSPQPVAARSRAATRREPLPPYGHSHHRYAT